MSKKQIIDIQASSSVVSNKMYIYTAFLNFEAMQNVT